MNFEIIKKSHPWIFNSFFSSQTSYFDQTVTFFFGAFLTLLNFNSQPEMQNSIVIESVVKALLDENCSWEQESYTGSTPRYPRDRVLFFSVLDFKIHWKIVIFILAIIFKSIYTFILLYFCIWLRLSLSNIKNVLLWIFFVFNSSVYNVIFNLKYYLLFRNMTKQSNKFVKI